MQNLVFVRNLVQICVFSAKIRAIWCKRPQFGEKWSLQREKRRNLNGGFGAKNGHIWYFHICCAKFGVKGPFLRAKRSELAQIDVFNVKNGEIWPRNMFLGQKKAKR